MQSSSSSSCLGWVWLFILFFFCELKHSRRYKTQKIKISLWALGVSCQGWFVTASGYKESEKRENSKRIKTIIVALAACGVGCPFYSDREELRVKVIKKGNWKMDFGSFESSLVPISTYFKSSKNILAVLSIDITR